MYAARVFDDGIPGIAAGLDDGLLVRPDPEREEPFPEEQPDAFDRVAFWRIGRLVDEGNIVGHGQGFGVVPSGSVQHHDGVFVFGQGLGEFVEKYIHGGGRHGGQDEGEGITGFRVGCGEHIGPVEALIAYPWWPLPLGPPAVTQASLLTDAGFVLEEKANPFVWVGRLGLFQGLAKFFFLNRSWASGSVLG